MKLLPLTNTMQFLRMRNTRFPSYVGYVNGKAVCRVEMAGKRSDGWCVFLFDEDPGTDDARLEWHYHFADAKAYARTLAKEVA